MSQPSLSTPTTKRLLHELQAYHHQSQSQLATSSTTDDPTLVVTQLAPINEADLTHWTATIKGPPGTPYEGGRWNISIRIPTNYPMAPPDVRFVTRICHPNVNFVTGEICLDLLKDAWSAAYTIVQTLMAVQMLLVDPGLESPLNVDIAGLWRAGDKVGAEALVRFYMGEI